MFLATKSNKQEHFLIKNVIKKLESVYPNATKMPNNETQKAIDIFYESEFHENIETMINRTKKDEHCRII